MIGYQAWEYSRRVAIKYEHILHGKAHVLQTYSKSIEKHDVFRVHYCIANFKNDFAEWQ